ncbi:membrane protein [Mycobacterium tuberculosis]|nr:membrane protein [Mycobacterium tuberculosis]
MRNSVTVDSVDTIEAAGFNNEVTYHSGSPKISNAGGSNSVQQG